MTKNEEAVITRCIRSVLWADEVLVIDSCSTDNTVAMATALGATLHEQPWLGFSAQRNRGAELARHDWVLFVDADEIVTPELAASVQEVMRHDPDGKNGYAVDRRGDFLGLLLPNETRASKRKNFIRLYNRRFSRYDPAMSVHEEVRFPGEAIALEGLLLHWNGLGMDDYIPLFNRYASLEAAALEQEGVRARTRDILIRPLLRFGWSYFIKGGWRLGTRGLIHAMLKGVSDYLRYAKLWEMQNVTPMPDPPATIYHDSVKQVGGSVSAELQR